MIAGRPPSGQRRNPGGISPKDIEASRNALWQLLTDRDKLAGYRVRVRDGRVVVEKAWRREPLGGYFSRVLSSRASGRESRPARRSATAQATAWATLRTSPCTASSRSSPSWLVAYGS